jgi:hypothetical protein
MKSLKTVVLSFACINALAAIGAAFSASSETSAPVHDFEFTYLLLFRCLILMINVGRIYPVPNALKLRVLASISVLERMFPLLVAQCAGAQYWGASRQV